MITSRQIALLFLCCFFSNAFSEPNSSGKISIKTQDSITLGQSYIIQTSEGQTPIEVNIYLPDSYNVKSASDNNQTGNSETNNKPKRYPVLYLIDGGKQQDFKQIAGLGALASINPYIFDEFIVVGVATENRLFQLTSKNFDKRYDRPEGYVGGSDEFRANIKNVVQPFIDSTYRTSSKKIVAGESLAGLFICETLLKTPELFTDYIAVSPSLWYDDRRLAKQAPELLEKHDDTAKTVYLTMANEGGTMQKGLDELLEAFKKSDLENLKTHYVDRRKNAFHWTIYHDAVLDALRWILPVSAPGYADDEDPWYLIEGANPPGWKES